MQMLEPARARIRVSCLALPGADLDLKFDPYYLTSFIRSVGWMMLKRVERTDGRQNTSCAIISKHKAATVQIKLESALELRIELSDCPRQLKDYSDHFLLTHLLMST